MARSYASGPTGISSRFWLSWASPNNPDSSCLLRATRSAALSPLMGLGPGLCRFLHPNFRELRHGEVRRIHHRRTSGSVKLHSWVTTLGQQGTEVQVGRSSTLGCTSL